MNEIFALPGHKSGSCCEPAHAGSNISPAFLSSYDPTILTHLMDITVLCSPVTNCRFQATRESAMREPATAFSWVLTKSIRFRAALYPLFLTPEAEYVLAWQAENHNFGVSAHHLSSREKEGIDRWNRLLFTCSYSVPGFSPGQREIALSILVSVERKRTKVLVASAVARVALARSTSPLARIPLALQCLLAGRFMPLHRQKWYACNPRVR